MSLRIVRIGSCDGYTIIIMWKYYGWWVWVDQTKPFDKMGSRSYSVCLHCGDGFGLTDPYIVAWWFMVINNFSTLWEGVWINWSRPYGMMGFGVILNSPILWEGVWVDRPEPCGKMDLGSSSIRPHCGRGFGSTDPNLVVGRVQGHSHFVHTVGRGLGRPT